MCGVKPGDYRDQLFRGQHWPVFVRLGFYPLLALLWMKWYTLSTLGMVCESRIGCKRGHSGKLVSKLIWIPMVKCKLLTVLNTLGLRPVHRSSTFHVITFRLVMLLKRVTYYRALPQRHTEALLQQDLRTTARQKKTWPLRVFRMQPDRELRSHYPGEIAAQIHLFCWEC